MRKYIGAALLSLFFLLVIFPVKGKCSNELVILYTADTIGYVEPCG